MFFIFNLYELNRKSYESDMDQSDEEEMDEENPNGKKDRHSGELESMSASDKKAMEEKNDSLVAHFFMAIVWSIGAVLKQSSREKFSSFFHDLCDNSIGKYPK